MTVPEFRSTVWNYYREHGRSFPWRETVDPYAIVVSELMLQQTQADRVVGKFVTFLSELPTWEALASVETKRLLELWQGLGYNRRALNLKRMAEVVVADQFPRDKKMLEGLPGIGPYTAGAVMAFAYNLPVTIIETNIRRAFIHHFFEDIADVPDTELFPLIEEALDRENPREWYWALMDYGSWLAKEFPNANRRSKHYTKQSKFEGSLRQLRGEILRLVTESPQTFEIIVTKTGQSPERVEKALSSLVHDGFMTRSNEEIKIAS